MSGCCPTWTRCFSGGVMLLPFCRTKTQLVPTQSWWTIPGMWKQHWLWYFGRKILAALLISVCLNVFTKCTFIINSHPKVFWKIHLLTNSFRKLPHIVQLKADVMWCWLQNKSTVDVQQLARIYVLYGVKLCYFILIVLQIHIFFSFSVLNYCHICSVSRAFQL